MSPMLLDEIKKRLGVAMKAKNDVEREVLRVALGEIQTLEARTQRPPTDDEAVAILRKLVKSNEETKSVTTDDARKTVLEQEIAVLAALLPKGPSLDELVAQLAPVKDAIRAAGNDGQATGVAIKHLKSQGTNAPGSDVAAAVKRVRAG